MQAAIFRWAGLQLTVIEDLEWLFHVGNGGARPQILRDGRRFSVVAARLKAEGVKAGVPDIWLPVPRGGAPGLLLELKAGKNTESDEQRRWLHGMAKLGWRTFVVRDEKETAITLIARYLAGTLTPEVVRGLKGCVEYGPKV